MDDTQDTTQGKSLRSGVRSSEAVGIGDKVHFLSARSVYPDHPNKVEVEETHMSWVFLTDDYVYKLKKPVRYPFLDFSTLEARQANCQNEVRLNLRLAPEVYLGVIPLTLEETGEFALDGKGVTIDWLVKMCRLPANQMLDNSILDGKVRQEQVEALVNLLTKFYNNAEPADIPPETYLANFQHEHTLNRTLLEDPIFELDRARVKKILGYIDATLRDERGLLEERVLRGRIVEGHGDLKPEHICLLDPPVIIDCLEFNRNLRLMDPFDDLAFLCIECERLGASWISDFLTKHCAKQLQDGPTDRLFAFYKTFRACLRARLALAHLLEPDSHEPGKWIPRAKQYLDIAEHTCISLIPQEVEQSTYLRGSDE